MSILLSDENKVKKKTTFDHDPHLLSLKTFPSIAITFFANLNSNKTHA